MHLPAYCVWVDLSIFNRINSLFTSDGWTFMVAKSEHENHKHNKTFNVEYRNKAMKSAQHEMLRGILSKTLGSTLSDARVRCFALKNSLVELSMVSDNGRLQYLAIDFSKFQLCSCEKVCFL